MKPTQLEPDDQQSDDRSRSVTATRDSLLVPVMKTSTPQGGRKFMPPFFKSGRFLIGAAVVILALVTARPAYRVVKSWKADHLTAKAERQAAKGEWTEACQSLRSALLLDPDDARIIRTTARLLGEHGDPQALPFLEKLIQSPGGTPQDRIDLVRLALRIGQLNTVQPHLLALLGEPATAHRFDVLFLASEWHGSHGDRTLAVGFAREALAQTRDDAQTVAAKLFLARLLLQPAPPAAAPPDARLAAEAKKILREVASCEDRAGLEALLMLSEVCEAAPSPDEARLLGERLGRHPLAGDEESLLGLTWKLRSEPDQREKILDGAVSTFSKRGTKGTAAIGRWLVQNHEARRAIRLIPMATARENRELFLIYVDALADLGRWQDLQILLAGRAPLPVDPTIRNLYEFRTALALGRGEESRQHWSDVRKSMVNADPKTVLYVAQYAERLGMRDDAAKAYRMLTGIAGAERAGYLGLILLTEQSGDTRKLRDQMREFAGRYPSEFEPQNDLAYLDLLLNENVPESMERTAKLVKRFPDMLAYRTTLALAHLRAGDAAAARKVYDGVTINWSTAKPGWHAVYAAVLAASGGQALAHTHAGQIQIARLKPEERVLIAGL